MLERLKHLDQVDPDIGELIRQELERQNRKIELIASENVVSEAVMEAMATSSSVIPQPIV
jgi:glycine hydroxymethyltransferase